MTSLAPNCSILRMESPTSTFVGHFIPSVLSVASCSRNPKPEISGQKPPGVKFRTFSSRHLHQPFPDPRPVLRRARIVLVLRPRPRFPSLVHAPQNRTKPNEKGRGSKNRTLCINDLQQPKPNGRSVFPHDAPANSFVIGHSSLLPRLSTLHTQKWYFSRQNTPRVKMRRLAINNLRREKWYSTIFRRRATTHLESVGRCRANGKSRLLTVTNGCFRDSTPTTPIALLCCLSVAPSQNRSFLSTIPGPLQVIPGEYHLIQPPVFFPDSRDRSSPNQTTLSTIISNSE